MASSEGATLVNIALDLKIVICTFLHPSDILALRQTCKAFQLPTRQRVVWVEALHRVCLDNTLFLPSFPIPDMTVVELEHAAMGPRRWIELCAAFEKQHPSESGAQLCPRTTRTIEHPLASMYHCPEQLFIVPGGRFLVSHSTMGIVVWDLGYTSSADCKLYASVERKVVSYDCMVQATPDGIGLIISSFHSSEDCCVYEIYPESETPQLIQIAHLDSDPSVDPPSHLLPDKLIWHHFYEDRRIVSSVWDFRMNHSTSFSAEIDVNSHVGLIATKTAIIVSIKEGILIWAIPPLSPQPLDFSDHNPTHIPPLLRIPYPDVILRHSGYISWKRISHWYFGSSQPLYFDILLDSEVHRFKIIVKPDLYDTSLHSVNTSEVTHPHLFDDDSVFSDPYNICEDTLVACWYFSHPRQCGVYMSSRFANAVSHGGPVSKVLLPVARWPYSICPASGRFVYSCRNDSGIGVVDFL